MYRVEMRRVLTLIVASWLTFVGSPSPASSQEVDRPLALVHARVLDVSGGGHSANDIEDAVVLIQDDKIVDVGPLAQISIPDEAHVLDVSGKFIVPGLIDGFATLNNQAYANAYLYMGVTSVIAVGGGRRGDLFFEADPCPSIYLLGSVGRTERTDAELLQDIEEQAKAGAKVVLVMYKTTKEQLKIIVKRAHELGLATIGELGFASYEDGIAAGIDVFVHSTRYSLDAAPPELTLPVAKEPFSDDLSSPKWRYYKYLTNLALDDSMLQDHAERLGTGATFIMPTFSLLYLDFPTSENPWLWPVARILEPADINNPANRESGKHDYDEPLQKAYSNLALNILRIEKLYEQRGAKYLAGSATDVWGTMPGISLHTELAKLHEIGLTTREVLAAATGNFAEAFGWHHTGGVQPGRQADILVLNRNPLENLRHLEDIHLLVHSGKIIDRKALLENGQ